MFSLEERHMNFFAKITVTFFVLAVTASTAWALDCRNPQTQIDMNQCAGSDLERETKKINKTYNDYRAKLNPEQKQNFKEVQLSWIKFKDLACKFEASGVEGGSAYSMVLSGCLTAKTVQRNKEIEALANCQEGDLKCPAW
jgi:uncharacterized protein YecT (DUF1311 family)